MSDVHVTTSRLGDLLGTLAHPHRLLIVLGLADGPRDAVSLAGAVGISHMSVSEHLKVLRARQIVHETRTDARARYELTWPGLVPWLATGLEFLQGQQPQAEGRLVELPKSGQSV